MLEYLITSKVKRSLLKLFLTNPEKEFYVRDIARRVGEPLNAVRRELGYLEKAGLITPRHAGNLKYYSVVPQSPVYPELKKIIYATIGFGDYLAGLLQDAGQVDLAFIYGSVARNEENPRSDVDLFVVGEVNEDELNQMVSRIEADLGREVNYTVMSREEFRERRSGHEPFLERVMGDEKLLLKGSYDLT
jgi:predicted nucleotidyltransferase